MDKKISDTRLKEMFQQVREETGKNFSESLQNEIGKRHVTFDEFANKVVPALLGITFASATAHAEYLLVDLLEELDLIGDDE